jgi:hypothetical protein
VRSWDGEGGGVPFEPSENSTGGARRDRLDSPPSVSSSRPAATAVPGKLVSIRRPPLLCTGRRQPI